MHTLAAGGITPDEIYRFLLALTIMLGLAKLLGEVAAALKQPAVLGELLAGLVLGPTLLGRISPEAYLWLFPAEGNDFIGLSMLITLSAVLLLLTAGLEVDLSSVWRQGKAVVWVSLAGMVIPFVMGFALAIGAPGSLGAEPDDQVLPFALFVGIALSITALPVIAKVLMDLNLAKSDLGALIMSSAMINDLVGWIGFAMVLALIEPSAAASGIGVTIGLTLAFVGVMMIVGKPVVHKLLPIVQANTSWPGGVIVFVLVAAMGCAAITEWIGIHSIFGAFIAGVVIGDSRHLRQRTRDTMHQFVTNFFAPLFFASIGLRVDFAGSFDFGLVLLLLVLGCVGKIGGCWLGAMMGGLGKRVSFAVGCGMVARGAMEIILAQLAFAHGLIGEELFVAIVVMALVTSMIAGPAMRGLLHKERKRRLDEVITDAAFAPMIEGPTRDDALRQISIVAGKLVGLPMEAIFDRVMQRERIAPTGLPGGLAVPHARLDALGKAVIVVGISHGGVDFDASDGSKAHVICLLLTPTADPTAQLELLDMVGRAFVSAEARAQARQAKTLTEFRAALRTATSAEEAAHT